MRKIIYSILASCLTVVSYAQTVTPNLGMTLPAQGQLNWGTIYNSNLSIVDNFAGTTPSFPGTAGFIFATTAKASRVGTFGDVVHLFGSGSCSGYLFSDGTCHQMSQGLTSFTTGNLSPLFTTTLGGSPLTAPALAFTLSSAAANTVFGNFTGSTAVPTFSNTPVFNASGLTNFPTFNQSTTGNAATASALAATPTLCTVSGQFAKGILANGNATGCAAPPTPAMGVTSVGLVMPSWLTVTGSPVTSSGVITVAVAPAQPQAFFLATPASGTGALALRAIVASDLPTIASAHSDYANIAGSAFVTDTVLGPVYQEPFTVALKHLTVRTSGTISCSIAPTAAFVDLGTSPSTIFSGIAGTVVSIATSTSDGVFQFSGSVGMVAGDYYGFAFTLGTCTTAPQFDITAQVQ